MPSHSHHINGKLTPYQFILDWLDGEQQAMLNLVQDWSRVNSGSYNLDGLAEMGNRVRDAFSTLGADHDMIDLPDGELVDGSGNIRPLPYGPMHRFIKRCDAPRKILLTGHIDTVFPADSAFQTTRWVDDKTLNGPGVADMKGGIIVMLWALKALEKSQWAERLGYEILLSSDEEIGSVGSGPVLMERAGTADFGMTYEPALADGTLAGARKGSGNFTVIMRGRAAHAGREFDLGRNAVVALADFIGDLDGLNGRRDGVTINAAKLEGGGPSNIVPDLAICRFNIRVPRTEDQDWVMGEIKTLVAKYERCEGYEAVLHGCFNRPPKELTPANEALFEALKTCGAALGIPVAWQPTGGCCEGNNLAAAGLPNIDTLGVRGGKIHSADEFLCVDSLSERAKLSALMMMKYADGSLEGI